MGCDLHTLMFCVFKNFLFVLLVSGPFWDWERGSVNLHPVLFV